MTDEQRRQERRDWYEHLRQDQENRQLQQDADRDNYTVVAGSWRDQHLFDPEQASGKSSKLQGIDLNQPVVEPVATQQTQETLQTEARPQVERQSETEATRDQNKMTSTTMSMEQNPFTSLTTPTRATSQASSSPTHHQDDGPEL